MTTLGVIHPPSVAPEHLPEVARATEAAGITDLWLWEDCFKNSGIGPAAAALAVTERLQVGIGLMPVPLRNVALTAMEIASLARLFPGRLLPGIGHGVLDWMGQVGARAESPMTLLREYGTALRALLAGEELSVSGRYVSLDRVQLDWPPPPVPLYVGGVGPKTVALAGAIGDGLIFTGDTPVEKVRTGVEAARAAHAEAGLTTPLEVVCFADASPESLSREHVEALTDAGADRIVWAPTYRGEPDGVDVLHTLIEKVAALQN